jgi:hypothetical protein
MTLPPKSKEDLFISIPKWHTGFVFNSEYQSDQRMTNEVFDLQRAARLRDTFVIWLRHADIGIITNILPSVVAGYQDSSFFNVDVI